MIYLKNGGYLHKDGKLTENDVNNYSQMVESGLIVEEAKGDDLSKLTKDKLQLKCVELDIDYDEADTKAELIKKIKG